MSQEDAAAVAVVKLRSLVEQNAKLFFLGRIMGALLHDLNNPLTSISGNIELLLLNPALQDVKLQKRLDSVHASARKMADKLRSMQLLTLSSKLEERFDLNELVREVVTIAEIIPRYAKYPIKYSAYSEPIYCYGNSSKLGLALIALIDNAIDAIGDRHHPNLAVTVGKAEMATVAVSDNGGGVEISIKEKIFEPFFTTKEGRFGLGLYQSARYVAENQGSLSFETCESGSTFVISLPIA